MSSTIESLAASVAAKTADYRRQDGVQMTDDRVLRWIRQFSEPYQLQVLAEMDHILGQTYFSEERVDSFLQGLAGNSKLCGPNPSSFWPSVYLLEIQQHGSSQREMVAKFRSIIQSNFGVAPASNPPGADGRFVYLDDFIFTGGHLTQDLRLWIEHEAPERCKVDVITLALHKYGHYRAFIATNTDVTKTNLEAFAKAFGKSIDFSVWRVYEIEDRRRYISRSDVLKPKSAPNDPLVAAYVQELAEEQAQFNERFSTSYGLTWRDGDDVGALGIFSSGAARQLLEEQLLIEGCRVRSMCPMLPTAERPLGHQGLVSLGFGGLLVSYRNCPNNCPISWWAGDPWDPLFPRRTNRETGARVEINWPGHF